MRFKQSLSLERRFHHITFPKRMFIPETAKKQIQQYIKNLDKSVQR